MVSVTCVPTVAGVPAVVTVVVPTVAGVLAMPTVVTVVVSTVLGAALSVGVLMAGDVVGRAAVCAVA
ncbi:hypothetical protein ACSFCK_00820 [Brevibacterium luteolum]|uniref:hypothetical protein n=1 Tax=Brevibacterium luteolum TaxID=199591 RepID=UPI003EE9041C